MKLHSRLAHLYIKGTVFDLYPSIKEMTLSWLDWLSRNFEIKLFVYLSDCVSGFQQNIADYAALW